MEPVSPAITCEICGKRIARPPLVCEECKRKIARRLGRAYWAHRQDKRPYEGLWHEYRQAIEEIRQEIFEGRWKEHP